MSDQLHQHLALLHEAPGIACLAEISHGIEKESLRVDANGHLALTPHPRGLGSALTHATITTDFSEALMEFITPVFNDPQDSIGYLTDLHSYTYTKLPREELLWTSSMPCIIGPDEQIPLAQYGSSNVGRLKTLYRMGLSYRYGRSMQAIAGIHYNFSLPDRFWELYRKLSHSDQTLQDFKTTHYFRLIRNFRRHAWLLLYLFGASPALCKSFVQNRPGHGLEELDEYSLYSPYATSLRMGDLGYTSKAQASLHISYNSLDEYATGLLNAIKLPYEAYSHFNSPDGEPVQLNTSILQIENEFYSSIRPKRVSHSGVRPVRLLHEEGVEYIEVRLLDLNPFLPVGIDEEQIRFLNGFLLFCLLRDSPLTDADEECEIEANLQAAVRRGRDPALQLSQQGRARKLSDWADEVLGAIKPIAALLDQVNECGIHMAALQTQQAKVKDPELTPSAKVLRRMRETRASYFRFAMNQSLANSDYFRSRQLSTDAREAFERMSQESLDEQARIEAADVMDFNSYLEQLNAS